MKFGLHLKSHGIVDAEQLVAALEYQHSKVPPIGQLAIEDGVLNARQVFDVLRSQRDMPRERFGEVAVGMGLMSSDDLQRLLVLQWDRKPALADVLVELRILSQARADNELAAYRAAMQRHNVVVQRGVRTGRAHGSTIRSDSGQLALVP